MILIFLIFSLYLSDVCLLGSDTEPHDKWVPPIHRGKLDEFKRL